MRSRLFATLALLIAALFSGGCLKRTISVTTEPPGAIVWINDVEVGRTPLETDFTFYGKYDVRVRREGYEPIITSAKADTPIQEIPGIDVLSEVAPIQFHNIVHWHWDLVRIAENTQPTEKSEPALITRANQLRAGISPAAPAAPAPQQPQPANTDPKPPESKTSEPNPPAPPKPESDGLKWIDGKPLMPPSPAPENPPASDPKN